AVNSLRQRITQRLTNVREELDAQEKPLAIAAGQSVSLSNWYFKTGLEHPASGERRQEQTRELFAVHAQGPTSSGSWRTLVLLGPGNYEFSGRGRSIELGDTVTATNTGVLLRVSGERTPKGLSTVENWTPLRYEFQIQGIETVE